MPISARSVLHNLISDSLEWFILSTHNPKAQLSFSRMLLAVLYSQTSLLQHVASSNRSTMCTPIVCFSATPQQSYPSLNTHTPSTAPWVGGSIALPSPPTAAPVGKAPNWLSTDWWRVCPTEDSCSDVRWGGAQCIVACCITDTPGVIGCCVICPTDSNCCT